MSEVGSGQWPDNHRLLWVLSRLPRLSSLAMTAAQHGGSTAERMFLSHMELARLSCPRLRRLTADVATQHSSNNVWLPRATPLLENYVVRLASYTPPKHGVAFPDFSPTTRLASHPNAVELRVAGPTAFSLRSAALLQLPQLKVLSLHNSIFWGDDRPNAAACVPGLRELHVSGWLIRRDTGHPVFAPMLTRKLVRELIGLQHLQCLQLTVCVRPSYAPPQSASTKARRLRNVCYRIARCRANRRMWIRLWERMRPEADAPQLILEDKASPECFMTACNAAA